MYQEKVKTRSSSPKRIIIPKGSIQPDETIIIEIPSQLKDNSIFLARRKAPRGSLNQFKVREVPFPQAVSDSSTALPSSLQTSGANQQADAFYPPRHTDPSSIDAASFPELLEEQNLKTAKGSVHANLLSDRTNKEQSRVCIVNNPSHKTVNSMRLSNHSTMAAAAPNMATSYSCTTSPSKRQNIPVVSSAASDHLNGHARKTRASCYASYEDFLSMNVVEFGPTEGTVDRSLLQKPEKSKSIANLSYPSPSNYAAAQRSFHAHPLYKTNNIPCGDGYVTHRKTKINHVLRRAFYDNCNQIQMKQQNVIVNESCAKNVNDVTSSLITLCPTIRHANEREALLRKNASQNTFFVAPLRDDDRRLISQKPTGEFSHKIQSDAEKIKSLKKSEEVAYKELSWPTHDRSRTYIATEFNSDYDLSDESLTTIDSEASDADVDADFVCSNLQRNTASVVPLRAIYSCVTVNRDFPQVYSTSKLYPLQTATPRNELYADAKSSVHDPVCYSNQAVANYCYMAQLDAEKRDQFRRNLRKLQEMGKKLLYTTLQVSGSKIAPNNN